MMEIKQAAVWLEENASLQAAQNLLDKIIQSENQLANYPESGRPTIIGNTRYLILDKHKILFYRYTSKTVRVLALFDTRQDPKKRPY